MFCEVLQYSWTKGFYKRKGKSNVKGGWLRDQKEKKARKEIWERVSQVFGQCILLCLQLNLIYYWSDVDVGKLSNHLKLCVLYLALFYHPSLYFIIYQSPMDWESTCCEVWRGSIITWKNPTFTDKDFVIKFAPLFDTYGWYEKNI